MYKQVKPSRPTPKQLNAHFKHHTKCDPPPSSKIYYCNTPSPVRAIAEFEPMGGVLISYPGTVTQPSNQIQLPPTGPRSFGIPNDLIVRMQQANTSHPVHIFIMCADYDQQSYVIESLSNTAKEYSLIFDPKLVHFVPWDTDTYWTRDFGPWWIHNTVTGYYAIAKHVYTTLGGGSVGFVEGAETADAKKGSGIFRPNDDYGADKLSDFLNAPIRKWNNANWNNTKHLENIPTHDWFFTGLLDVGGNYMVTGDGIISSSYLVSNQNELPITNEKEVTDPSANIVEARMEYILEQLNRFMGVNTYHVLTDPSGTYIGHIDCWGKFLAPRKILIAKSEDPKANKAYDDISESFLKEGFEVFRVLCQNIYVPACDDSPDTTAAYTNSLILNDHVYVPLAGERYKEYDEKALNVYREALPDHTIVGIIGKPETPWLGTDALHCRTRGIPRAVVDNWLKSQFL